MKEKIAYRGAIFYFKDSATMANLPVNKDNVADKDCQYVYIEDDRNKVNDIFELLFILMTLGSEANIKATYIMGEAA